MCARHLQPGSFYPSLPHAISAKSRYLVHACEILRDLTRGWGAQQVLFEVPNAQIRSRTYSSSPRSSPKSQMVAYGDWCRTAVPGVCELSPLQDAFCTIWRTVQCSYPKLLIRTCPCDACWLLGDRFWGMATFSGADSTSVCEPSLNE